MPYGPRKSSDAKGVRGEEAGKRQRQRRAEDAEGASRLKNITPGAPGILETSLFRFMNALPDCVSMLRLGGRGRQPESSLRPFLCKGRWLTFQRFLPPLMPFFLITY